jgi:hypothetical protein
VQQTRVITYAGTGEEAASLFRKNAAQLAEEGYRPTSQSWADGSYTGGAVITALLLCLIGIGVFVLVYMLLVKPAGTLTVTYELRP